MLWNTAAARSSDGALRHPRADISGAKDARGANDAGRASAFVEVIFLRNPPPGWFQTLNSKPSQTLLNYLGRPAYLEDAYYLVVLRWVKSLKDLYVCVCVCSVL